MAERPTTATARSSRSDLSIWWYAVALLVYIPLGFFTQSVVMNWFVGPLFPLLLLFLGPTLVRRLTARRGEQQGELGRARV